MKTKITLVAGANPASVRFPEATRFQAATADGGRPATFTTIKDRLEAAGMRITRTGRGREMRVNFATGSEATATYTRDLREALAIGIEMAQGAHPADLIVKATR